MKRKPARGTATQADRDYWSRIPDVCQASGRVGGTVVHHILQSFPAKSGRRDHRFVVRLTPELHNMGTQSVHLLGGEPRFLAVHGVDLVTIAQMNWAQFGESL